MSSDSFDASVDLWIRVAVARTWLPLDCSAVVYRVEPGLISLDFWRAEPEPSYEEETNFVLDEFFGFGTTWDGDVVAAQRQGWPRALSRDSTIFLKYGEQHRLGPMIPVDEHVDGLSQRDVVQVALWRALLGWIPPTVSRLAFEMSGPDVRLYVRTLDRSVSGRNRLRSELLEAATAALPGVRFSVIFNLDRSSHQWWEMPLLHGAPAGGSKGGFLLGLYARELGRSLRNWCSGRRGSLNR